jgi:hypothetical protein
MYGMGVKKGWEPEPIYLLSFLRQKLIHLTSCQIPLLFTRTYPRGLNSTYGSQLIFSLLDKSLTWIDADDASGNKSPLPLLYDDVTLLGPKSPRFESYLLHLHPTMPWLPVASGRTNQLQGRGIESCSSQIGRYQWETTASSQLWRQGEIKSLRLATTSKWCNKNSPSSNSPTVLYRTFADTAILGMYVFNLTYFHWKKIYPIRFPWISNKFDTYFSTLIVLHELLNAQTLLHNSHKIINLCVVCMYVCGVGSDSENKNRRAYISKTSHIVTDYCVTIRKLVDNIVTCTQLLGKHIPATHAHAATRHPLLGNGPVDTSP